MCPKFLRFLVRSERAVSKRVASSIATRSDEVAALLARGYLRLFTARPEIARNDATSYPENDPVSPVKRLDSRPETRPHVPEPRTGGRAR